LLFFHACISFGHFYKMCYFYIYRQVST